MKEYLFVRLVVTYQESITKMLNNNAMQGWEVVSHAESKGEYTFVLARVENPYLQVLRSQVPSQTEFHPCNQQFRDAIPMQNTMEGTTK